MTTYQPIERDAPFASRETKARIHAEFSPATIKTILPKNELEQIRILNTKLQASAKAEAALTYDAARAAYKNLGHELTAHAANGDDAKLEAAPGWTFEDISEEFTEKRRAVRAHRAALSAAVWEIARNVRARWAAAALDLACDLEAAERATAERFALAYAPGPVPLAIRKAAGEMVDANCSPAGASSVSEMLPFTTF